MVSLGVDEDILADVLTRATLGDNLRVNIVAVARDDISRIRIVGIHVYFGADRIRQRLVIEDAPVVEGTLRDVNNHCHDGSCSTSVRGNLDARTDEAKPTLLDLRLNPAGIHVRAEINAVHVDASLIELPLHTVGLYDAEIVGAKTVHRVLVRRIRDSGIAGERHVINRGRGRALIVVEARDKRHRHPGAVDVIANRQVTADNAHEFGGVGLRVSLRRADAERIAVAVIGVYGREVCEVVKRRGRVNDSEAAEVREAVSLDSLRERRRVGGLSLLDKMKDGSAIAKVLNRKLVRVGRRRKQFDDKVTRKGHCLASRIVRADSLVWIATLTVPFAHCAGRKYEAGEVYRTTGRSKHLVGDADVFANRNCHYWVPCYTGLMSGLIASRPSSAMINSFGTCTFTVKTARFW